jgi:tRNA(fMet)-specific endonuclease VapC
VSYLLDTDVCVALLKGRDQELRQRYLSTNPAELFLCSVVKGELLFGARNSAQVDRNLRRLDRFWEPLGSVSFDDLAAAHYGELRATLKRAGTPIGGNDLLIAAIARANDMTLVTRNQDEFRRVVGLRVDSW